MRSSFLFSIFLHALAITFGILGLPDVRSKTVLQDIPMVVEILPMALKTNLPRTSKPQKNLVKVKKNKGNQNLKRPKPKLPQRSSQPVNQTKEAPIIIPVSKPKSKPAKKRESKTKRQAKPSQKANKILVNAKPRRKPKPPDRFAMVLKNLERDLAKNKTVKQKKKKKQPDVKSDIISRLSKSLSRESRNSDPRKEITISQRDAMINLIKRTMEPCWNFQAGSKKAQDIIVEIEVGLKADGRVLSARITNQSQLNIDPFRQAAGESALRAVLNPSCQPYRLPVNLYHHWKDLKLRFNPREMLGR